MATVQQVLDGIPSRLYRSTFGISAAVYVSNGSARFIGEVNGVRSEDEVLRAFNAKGNNATHCIVFWPPNGGAVYLLFS